MSRNACIVASACLLITPAIRAQIDKSKIVDLTHSFDENTIYWPTEQPFQWTKQAWGKTPAGYWYASARFASSEHLGTHVDAPIHFGEGQATTGRIPLTRLIGPAAVIDISKSCANDRDYQLSATDIAAWERSHGSIPRGAIVVVRTGWSKYWSERGRYMGTTTPGDVTHLHFPGISPEAAKLLVARRVDGVAIDTASLDRGTSTDFRTHQILNGAGIYGLENVADTEQLPATGATLIALPMKIRDGSGGPVRIIALLP